MQKMLMKTRKNIVGQHASLYFENEPNAKNAHENEKMYNRATCLCAFQKWAKCQKRSQKRKKSITGPHASVHFENGQNAKNEKNL